MGADILNNIKIVSSQNDIHIEIKTSPINNILFSFLVFIILACFAFPVSLFFIDEIDLGFGIIITFAIFWGTAIYFTRKVLWNKYGKEVYDIKKEAINYFFDYGFFRDHSTAINFSHLQIAYQKDDVIKTLNQGISGNSDFECYLIFIINNEKIIHSRIATSISNIRILEELYQDYSMSSSF